MRTIVETRVIEILTKRHRQTGLLVAYSEDLRGLLVSGRSESDLEEKLPAAVREMFEALDYRVLDVSVSRQDVGAFATIKFLVNAQVQAA